MRDEIAIDVRQCSKAYRVYPQRVDRLKQVFARRQQRYQEFWALRDVTFQVRPGEVVGIIGRNGSGKSTLLQIIAGTLAPTSGEIEIRGRVAALLELGSGFNIDFTGRENVHLNAALLGLTPRQVAERFDEIAAFADIGDFLDQPVKTYSSGMVVRLAFAVAAHVDASILIVDEALAVGDALFQARCFRRIERLRAAGVTILLATHDNSWVSTMCESAVLLESGAMVMWGAGKEVAEEYYRRVRQIDHLQMVESGEEEADAEPGETGMESGLEPVVSNQGTRMGDGRAQITGFGIYDAANRPLSVLRARESVRIDVAVRFMADLQDPHIGVCLRDVHGRILVGGHTMYEGIHLGHVREGQQVVVSFQVPVLLNPGKYLLMLGVAEHEGSHVYRDCDTLFDYREIEVLGDARAWGVINVSAKVNLNGFTNGAVPTLVASSAAQGED